MSEVIRLPTNTDVEEEAAAWVWRLDSEAVTEADRQMFETWLRRDPRHRRAFVEFGGVWRQLDDLATAKRPEKIATFTHAPVRTHARRTLLWVAGVAASVAVAISSYVLLPHQSSSETVATAVGQQRSVTLADQSVVTLNTNSIVETRLAADVRDVYLRKGEAYFVVAHDRTRPFLVHAGSTIVRAVGTAFDVRVRDGTHVEVTVNEGRVEVPSTELPTDDPTLPQPRKWSAAQVLVAGEKLLMSPEGVVVRAVSAQDLATSMAWRQGAVVFEGQPLGDAAAELSRYTDTRFVVTDPRIKGLPVGGRFKTDDVDGFLFALENALPVKIRRAPGGLVYIEPRS